jgi:hypothetical protein
MSTTTKKLAELNTLRAARNQPPLKSWKGSTAALDQTLVAYKTRKVDPAVAEGAYPTAKQAEHATGLKGTDAKARDAIAKANTPKVSKTLKAMEKTREQKAAKTAAKTKPASDLVSLADIARELKIEPKLARAKARRSVDIQKLAQGDSWSFKPADAAKVKALLK